MTRKTKATPDIPAERVYARMFVCGDLQYPVRTVIDDDGQRLTVASDLGHAIGHKNIRALLPKLGVTPAVKKVYSAGRVQPMQLLTDAQTSRVLGHSTRKAAVEFRDAIVEQAAVQPAPTALAVAQPTAVTKLPPEAITQLRAVIERSLAKRDEQVHALKCIVDDQQAVITRMYAQLRELQVPRRPTTAHVRDIVLAHVRRINGGQIPQAAIQHAFGTLYADFQSIYRTNLVAKGRKSGESGLKACERLGEPAVRKLLVLALNLYGPAPLQAELPPDVGNDNGWGALLLGGG